MADDRRRQLLELQNKLIEFTQRGKGVALQIRQAENDARRAALTGQEVSSLPEDTPVYNSIGRAFVLSTQKEVLNELEAEIKTSDGEVAKLKGNKEYLERQARETETNLRELLESTPDLAKAVLSN